MNAEDIEKIKEKVGQVRLGPWKLVQTHDVKLCQDPAKTTMHNQTHHWEFTWGTGKLLSELIYLDIPALLAALEDKK